MSVTGIGNTKRRGVIEEELESLLFLQKISLVHWKRNLLAVILLCFGFSSHKTREEVPSTELFAVGLAADFENVMCLCCFRD